MFLDMLQKIHTSKLGENVGSYKKAVLIVYQTINQIILFELNAS